MDLEQFLEKLEKRFDKFEDHMNANMVSMRDRVIRQEQQTDHLTRWKERAERRLDDHDRAITMGRGVWVTFAALSLLVGILVGLDKLNIVPLGDDRPKTRKEPRHDRAHSSD